MSELAVVMWSGGKDSLMALRRVLEGGRYSVEGLLTTVVGGEVNVHRVRRELLERQAASLGTALSFMDVPPGAKKEEYEPKLREALLACRERGVRSVVFGDVFLAGVREYHERVLASLGMSGVFPLWGEDTAALAEEFIRRGYGAVIVAADARKISASFAGGPFDDAFLDSLPENADPCGENGEFHTFAHDGPIFERKVEFDVGETTGENGYLFTDLVPKRHSTKGGAA